MTPHKQTMERELAGLQAELDRQHFGGRLAAAGWRTVRIVPLPAKHYGSAVYNSRTIRIAEHSVDDAVETRKTLLHEMIHAWLRLIGDPSHQGRNEAHGVAFKAELDRLIAAGEDVRSEHEYVTCGDTSPERLQAAVTTYLARQSRRDNPDGYYDNAGRWFPNSGEAQVCCRSQRHPSRAYPYSLRAHCCTMTHISRLFGVDTVALRAGVAAAKRANVNNTTVHSHKDNNDQTHPPSEAPGAASPAH